VRGTPRTSGKAYFLEGLAGYDEERRTGSSENLFFFFGILAGLNIMITDPESLVAEIREHPGVKDVDIVHFPLRKELWVVLREPVDLSKLRAAAVRSGYTVTKVGSFASRLPRSLAEMIWDCVTYVITKHPHGWKRLESSGLRGLVGRIMRDLATGETVYHVNDEEGLDILKEYLKSQAGDHL